MDDKSVFVLGAGFTRAFVPESPLLVDDYQIPRLRERFASFSYARAVLDDALSQGSEGRVDLERLMTRLSGMPYDGAGAGHELTLLESELRKALVKRLSDAKEGGVDRTNLDAFARFVLKKEASVVTFNYDDVFDQALWDVHRAEDSHHTEPYWHPDGGYGFFCRPSTVCVADGMVFMDRPRSLLLKLHGSINWRARLGEGAPRGPAALLHHENWFPHRWGNAQYESTEIEPLLEIDPFIVPPVLVKSELTVHPVLQVVWKLAYQKLANATNVVFIGYSLPATDLASRCLFRETLANRKNHKLRIVNIAGDGVEQERVKGAYRSLFNGLDIEFDFSGASACIQREFSEALVPPAENATSDRH